MNGKIYTTTIKGSGYTYWADFIMRATYAKCEATGEVKMIKGSGYLNNDLTARKAIACAFGLDSFRK